MMIFDEESKRDVDTMLLKDKLFYPQLELSEGADSDSNEVIDDKKEADSQQNSKRSQGSDTVHNLSENNFLRSNYERDSESKSGTGSSQTVLVQQELQMFEEE